MSDIGARLVQARLEAAFDRYNRSVIEGTEPTLALFMEALEAEGLELSLKAPASGEPARPGPRDADHESNRSFIRLGRRAQGLVARRSRGLS